MYVYKWIYSTKLMKPTNYMYKCKTRDIWILVEMKIILNAIIIVQHKSKLDFLRKTSIVNVGLCISPKEVWS